MRLFKLAAATGNHWGEANLAWMYEFGRGGLARDRTEAVRLYRDAAKGNA